MNAVLNTQHERLLGEVAQARVLRHLPDGTGAASFKSLADAARLARDRAEKTGEATWLHLAREKFWEVMAEPDPAVLRAGLVGLAADCLAWAEDIDGRN